MIFGTVDAKKMEFPHTDNLVVCLNITNCILWCVLIDLTTDVSIMYTQVFEEIGLLYSMLSPPHWAIKTFDGDLCSALGTIRLPVKLDNDNDGYIHIDETFLG